VIIALKKLGAIVEDELAIYTHSLKESENNFKRLKVKLHFLTNTKQVAQVAKKQGYLKDKQIKIIEQWITDPKNWAKKMGYV
jgi:orotate phosphoribosyltransferase